jgi:hypothetical protein
MTRRRRRVLIVISVLALLIGGLPWLTRREVDPRLVGLWVQRHPRGYLFWKLAADGTSEQWPEEFDAVRNHRWQVDWWKEGDGIVFATPGPGRYFPAAVLDFYKKIFRKPMAGQVTRRVDSFEVTEGAVRLRTGPGTETWYRVVDRKLLTPPARTNLAAPTADP